MMNFNEALTRLKKGAMIARDIWKDKALIKYKGVVMLYEISTGVISDYELKIGDTNAEDWVEVGSSETRGNDEKKRISFIRDIAEVINKHNIDTYYGTPDYILADHLNEQLQLLGDLKSKINYHNSDGNGQKVS